MKQKLKTTGRISYITRGNTRDGRAIKEALKRLRGSVIFYKNPYQPVGLDHWEALK